MSTKKLLKFAILPVLLMLIALVVKAGTGNDSSEIKKVMDAQETAWNNGDLDGFMAGYWRSDKVKFVSKNGVTYGWQKVYDNYKKSYPDKAAMGNLKFEIISIESLDDENFHAVSFGKKNKAYMVTGKWETSNTSKAANGFFTLIFKKINGNWVIVADHTS